MTLWDEQTILLSSTKTEWKCTRAAKRSLMKILSAWWKFRSSKCWNLFLSADRLKQLFWSHLWKNCLFSNYPPWMNHWEEQSILPSYSKTEQKCTRAAKRKMMKILGVWWNFRSSKCWNVFLSVDRLKPLFWCHMWRNSFFSENPPWINHWDEQNILLSESKGSRSAPRLQKEIWWRYWVHGETSEVVSVGTCF